MLGGLIFQRKIDVMIVQFMIPASEELVQPSTCQFFGFFFFFCLERGLYLKRSLYLFNV